MDTPPVARIYHDLEDSYPGADGGGGGTPDTYRPLVVGRIELSRTPTLRTDPPVPGSRLALVEGRLAQLEADLQALVKALDRHFTPRRKKKRRA